MLNKILKIITVIFCVVGLVLSLFMLYIGVACWWSDSMWVYKLMASIMAAPVGIFGAFLSFFYIRELFLEDV